MCSSDVPNDYADSWFRAFHLTIPADRTAREVAFLETHCLGDSSSVADLCCGYGRHALALANRGHCVFALDRHAAAVDSVRIALPPSSLAVDGDVRAFRTLVLKAGWQAFDAVLVMGQTFGHFDANANAALLQDIAESLNPGGHLVLDLWHRPFFDTRLGAFSFDRPEGRIFEEKTLVDGRLNVSLRYPDGLSDSFDWQLWLPSEAAAALAAFGLETTVLCTEFNAARPPTADDAKYQIVARRSD